MESSPSTDRRSATVKCNQLNTVGLWLSSGIIAILLMNEAFRFLLLLITVSVTSPDIMNDAVISADIRPVV